MSSLSPRTRLRLVPLEDRYAPATLLSPIRLTYQDTDGDTVAVTFSKPVLNADNVNTAFTFDSGGAVNASNAAREQLRKIDLTAVAGAAGTTISTVATRSAATGGDGFAALGMIDAGGIDLGAVTIDGDLGRVLAGDATTATPGLRGLTVHSLGRYGTSTGADDLTTGVQGRLDFLRVKTDVKEAGVHANGGDPGQIGSVTVGGSLLGGTGTGMIASTGAMGPVKIGGNIQGGTGTGSGWVYSGSTLAGVTVGGSLIGSGTISARIASIGAMGPVKVGGNIQGGAGNGSGQIFSGGTVASVTVGGSLIGGAGNSSGSISVVGDLGTVKIAGDVQGGTGGTGDLTLSGSVEAKRIGTLIVGGSLIAGVDTDPSAGVFKGNGAVHAADDIGTATLGNLIGNSSSPAVLSARGSATPTATSDVAIGKLTIRGRVELAQVLAGFNLSGAAVNADAQIGTVRVGGDWIASTIAAGVVAGNDGYFGNADANEGKMLGGVVKDVAGVSSRIGSVSIAGQVLGTVGGTDFFGIAAEAVGSVKIGGVAIPLSAGNGNDDAFVGVTGDFKINEV
jgi:hypothetical protein